jgi:hypothetical protein
MVHKGSDSSLDDIDTYAIATPSVACYSDLTSISNIQDMSAHEQQLQHKILRIIATCTHSSGSLDDLMAVSASPVL